MMSDSALKTSNSLRAKRRGKLGGSIALVGALILGSAAAIPAQAQGTKIGFVNTERILRESGPAKAAQSKIEAEFKKRDDELQRLNNSLRSQAEKFDKDAPVLSESDRVKRQRELSNLDTDLQRKRREFQEDFNRRRNEEFSGIVTKANDAIKRIAEQENYDLIIQDAVTVNPRIDITDKVIQSLGK
ncbi:OmpH family outer membrane protein [Achromobacter insolitus]|uniref:Chaperone protein Skp n=1 Tax=Achromobacter insolitus TaxID=217204 RepID=A0A6S7F0W1_9BURK|nr:MULTISPECIES: OmpH family outer membrane protein [Achromobacter]GLK93934.1 outer membrane protein chaperone [Achromobacter xylosoxidans]APX74164.1 outer membrane protein chaperone [Achromobacter insolitus]AVG39011.1 outer membrane protein chaperone [Achromobacter insolitus]AXA69694.1 outer membrane protein chaperone [Achromobacter insolitus]MCP1403708.1 outer membrane protein [Achromobacter insolitus]